MTAARNRRGETVRFVSNWSWEPAGVKLPVAVRDLLSDEELREGTKLSLGAWDVRVLVEKHPGGEQRGGETP